MTLKGFFDRLNLDVKLLPVESGQVEYVAQLTQQTAAFNLTAIGCSADEIRDLLAAGDLEWWVVEVRDRFGDYGMTGVVIFAIASDVLVVDNFLLSCRVLGKNVEYIALKKLAQIARERGCSKVYLRYRATSRNGLAGEFVKGIGMQWVRMEESGFSVTWPVEMIEALALNFDLAGCHTAESAAVKESTLSDFWTARWLAFDPREKSDLLTRIATSLRTGEQIWEAIRTWKRRTRPELGEGFVAPRAPVEEVLAGIWAQVLNVEQVGIHDNFFKLGGHSLLATQIISRIREAFHVELSLRNFFENPTIVELAKMIEEIITKKVEDLTEDEAQRFLSVRS